MLIKQSFVENITTLLTISVVAIGVASGAIGIVLITTKVAREQRDL